MFYDFSYLFELLYRNNLLVYVQLTSIVIIPTIALIVL